MSGYLTYPSSVLVFFNSFLAYNESTPLYIIDPFLYK